MKQIFGKELPPKTCPALLAVQTKQYGHKCLPSCIYKIEILIEIGDTFDILPLSKIFFILGAALTGRYLRSGYRTCALFHVDGFSLPNDTFRICGRVQTFCMLKTATDQPQSASQVLWYGTVPLLLYTASAYEACTEYWFLTVLVVPTVEGSIQSRVWILDPGIPGSGSWFTSIPPE
jgi:hypothetical protein